MTLTALILDHASHGSGLRQAISHARLTAARQAQPLAELARKAAKATRRQNIWTEEELDLGTAEAKALWPWWSREGEYSCNTDK